MGRPCLQARVAGLAVGGGGVGDRRGAAVGWRGWLGSEGGHERLSRRMEGGENAITGLRSDTSWEIYTLH